MSWPRALTATGALRSTLLCQGKPSGYTWETAIRYASTSTKGKVAPRQPTRVIPVRAKQPHSAAQAEGSVRAGTPIRPLEARPAGASDSDWPWHKMDLQPEGWLVEYRIIYARPSELFGLYGKRGMHRIKWGLVFGLVIILQALAWPNQSRMDAFHEEFRAREAAAQARGGLTPEEIEAQRAEYRKRFGFFGRVLRDIDAIRLVFVVSTATMMFIVFRKVDRNVKELRHIRRTPTSTALREQGRQVENTIRLTSSMWDVGLPGLRGVKDYELGKTKMTLIPGLKEGQTILGFRSEKVYKEVDMTVTKRLQKVIEASTESGPEVVLSMKRMEQVWGKIRVGEPQRAFWAPLSDWIDSAARKVEAKKGEKGEKGQ